MIHVLYVDDEPDLPELGKTFLEQSGDITVITVTSAHLALEQLQRNPVDAVVSDFHIAGRWMGYPSSNKIRGRDVDLPFILFTGKRAR